MRYALLLAVLSTAAAADQREVFYGTWGTPEACAGRPIKPGGTVRAAPVVIDEDWLRHGHTWCRLDWYPIEPREGGLFTGAHAQCGEDAVRAYIVGMDLSQGTLTLRWNVIVSNGPLARCTAP